MVKVIGQRSRSPGQKRDLGPHLTGFQAILKVKGHMGQGQKSHWSMSKVMGVKVSLKVRITGKQT